MSANVYAQKIIDNYAPIAYFPLWEASGTNIEDITDQVSDGTLSGTVTLGATGIGDGNTAATFGGGHVNIYSAALNTAFDATAGSLVCWAKVSGAGVWSDSTIRYASILRADAQNQIWFIKSDTADRVSFRYEANNVALGTNHTTTTTDWFMMTITWSGPLADDEVKTYFNDSQTGATDTGLGTWAGALSSTECCIGAEDTSNTAPWSGAIAHVIPFDTVLALADIQDIYQNINAALNPQSVVYNVKPRVHYAGV